MKTQSIARISMIAVLGLMPAMLSAAGSASVQQAALEKEGLELIDQIEDVARSIHFNTDRLVAHGRIHMSKWTHAHHLNDIKGLINEGLRPAVSRLAEIQEQLPEWKQKSVERMMASAKALAADTNSAIFTMNENGGRPVVLNEQYRALLDSMDEHAENLVRTADAAGEFAAAHSKAIEAAQSLKD